jgi:aspartate/methionine/tyrosine aminotransferase
MKPFAVGPYGMRRSGIREVMDLAANMTDVIHLEVGEPDFPTPAHIVEAAAAAARDGFTRYTPNPGLVSLREIITAKLATLNGLNVGVDSIIVTPGAVAGVASAMIALVEPGEQVLLPDPGWPNYRMQAEMIGAQPIGYPLLPETGFLPDFDAMERLISPRTKLIVVNSPSNPTGCVWPKRTLADMLAFAQRHDLYLLSDEVYEAIVFEGEHHSPAADDSDGRVISIFGFSKTYAMTGWRLGYVVAPLELASVIAKLQEPLVSCASAVSQKAAEAALTGPQDVVAQMCHAYRQRRDACLNVLKSMDQYSYTPQGAFYLMMDVAALDHDSYAAARKVLLEEGVATAPGATFGKVAESYLRVSLAAEVEQLLEGVSRICRRVKSAHQSRTEDGPIRAHP